MAIDYPSLTGSMKLEAAKGQFAKLDPGAAGKLFGPDQPAGPGPAHHARFPGRIL